MAPLMDGPGWLRRLVAQAALPPDQARSLAEVLAALADMLRQPEGVSDWPTTVAHADRLAAADPRAYRGLANTLHSVQRLAEGPEEARLRVAAEMEEAVTFLRGTAGG
jgi:hypothetical protein